MRFYGRQNELAALHRALTIVRTQSSLLISVLGRRRVGKTTLIAKAFENAAIPVFSFFVQMTRRGLPQFLGRTLELWYRASFLESGQWTGVGAWWDDKGQNEIDLVAVNELEGKLFFGEAKLNPAKYNALELERRKELFLLTRILKVRFCAGGGPNG